MVLRLSLLWIEKGLGANFVRGTLHRHGHIRMNGAWKYRDPVSEGALNASQMLGVMALLSQRCSRVTANKNHIGAWELWPFRDFGLLQLDTLDHNGSLSVRDCYPAQQHGSTRSEYPFLQDAHPLVHVSPLSVARWICF